MRLILKVTTEGAAAAGALIVNTTGSTWAWATVTPTQDTENARASRAQQV